MASAQPRSPTGSSGCGWPGGFGGVARSERLEARAARRADPPIGHSVRVAYFDCIAGISGDMALGALIDAGADFEQIRAQLATLPVEPFELELEEVETFGLRATRVSVHAGITGTAVALHALGVERVFASPVPTGLGMTKTEHGAMPIPGPAVVELLRGAPLYSRGVTVELVTPTGAAILAALAEGYGDLPLMRVETVGYGAGSHRLDFPNVLRVLVGPEEERHRTAPSLEPAGGDVVLETNVDDLNPELYEYVLERLFQGGVQDAWLTPIVMKKGRPAVTVSVLCSAERAEAVRGILFRETGTLGIRSTPVTKEALERELLKVETSHGPVAVKVGFMEGRAITVAPEYEDCARAAREAGVPARDVYEEALRLAREELGRS